MLLMQLKLPLALPLSLWSEPEEVDGRQLEEEERPQQSAGGRVVLS